MLEVDDCNLFADHPRALYRPRWRLRSWAVGPPGKSRLAQWGPKAGEGGVDAKGLRDLLVTTRTDENLAVWAGTLAEGK